MTMDEARAFYEELTSGLTPVEKDAVNDFIRLLGDEKSQREASALKIGGC